MRINSSKASCVVARRLLLLERLIPTLSVAALLRTLTVRSRVSPVRFIGMRRLCSLSPGVIPTDLWARAFLAIRLHASAASNASLAALNRSSNPLAFSAAAAASACAFRSAAMASAFAFCSAASFSRSISSRCRFHSSRARSISSRILKSSARSLSTRSNRSRMTDSQCVSVREMTPLVPKRMFSCRSAPVPNTASRDDLALLYPNILPTF